MVINASTVRFDHLYQQPDYRLGCVELTSALAFGAGKLAEKVFVDTTEDIFGTALFVAKTDSADEVNEFTETLLIKGWPGIILWQHAFEGSVLLKILVTVLHYSVAFTGLFDRVIA